MAFTKLKAAVVGAGKMGSYHINVLSEISNCEIVCVVDPYIEVQNYPSYKNIDDLLSDQDIDFAIIATPSITHAEIAEYLIKNGVHILIEKPVCTEMKDFHSLISAQNEYGVKIVVGHIERFNPVVRDVISRINYDVEEIIHFSITRKSEKVKRIKDVGIDLDLSVHDLDLINFISNQEIVKCDKFYSQDQLDIMLRMKNDRLYTIHNNYFSKKAKRLLDIITTKNEYNLNLMHIGNSNPLKDQDQAFINYITDDNLDNLCLLNNSFNTMKFLL